MSQNINLFSKTSLRQHIYRKKIFKFEKNVTTLTNQTTKLLQKTIKKNDVNKL
ncbi:hypothetical protein HanIR_Chr16g0798741 [Helianthus annuus]|nr:hypothetical protein HanIR_Chr16g0798741 [Helianthus annuus]